MKSAAVILGGYVNAYSIVSELYAEGIKDVFVINHKVDICKFSNKIKTFIKSPLNTKSLYKDLCLLNQKYSKLIIYPTQDLHLELLLEIEDQINTFCYIPFNSKNLLKCLDKTYQYEVCEKIGVPCPKTVTLKSAKDYQYLSKLLFPIIIKPTTRLDKKVRIFRSLFVENEEAWEKQKDKITVFFKQGVSFMASEVIPGDGSNIHSYMGYRSKEGNILNEWIGKKITQFPNDFGVFSSATNSSSKIVLEQGRKLLKELNLHGINQPEFKYDYRDGQYKLMEINLRSMMWNRVGYLSGVKLHLTQWQNALEESVKSYTQKHQPSFRFLYLKHELICLLFRKGYYKNYFKKHFKNAERVYIAVYDENDLKPFIFDQYKTLKSILGRCLKALRIISE